KTAVSILAKCACIWRYELQAVCNAGLTVHAEIMRVDIADTRNDEEQNDADLYHHDDRVKIRRLADALYEQGGNRNGDEHRRQVEKSCLDRCVDTSLSKALG